jgi:hypothetical protein
MTPPLVSFWKRTLTWKLSDGASVLQSKSSNKIVHTLPCSSSPAPLLPGGCPCPPCLRCCLFSHCFFSFLLLLALLLLMLPLLPSALSASFSCG